jgi:hypothetical protein
MNHLVTTVAALRLRREALVSKREEILRSRSRRGIETMHRRISECEDAIVNAELNVARGAHNRARRIEVWTELIQRLNQK